MAVEICPGILTHTLEEYVHRLELIEESAATWAHIDVMDGQFVPNISVMPHEFMGISTSLKLEAHLMAYQPERYFSDLTVAGVSRVLLHREAYDSFEECGKALVQAGDYFAEVGVVYNPETSLEEEISQLPVQAVLCMGVHPGASGQPLLPETYDRIKVVQGKTSAVVAVDGGVSEENIVRLQESGASRFVITSHLFVANSVASSLQHFSQLLGGA